jgi:hypothetical protein
MSNPIHRAGPVLLSTIAAFCWPIAFVFGDTFATSQMTTESGLRKTGFRFPQPASPDDETPASSNNLNRFMHRTADGGSGGAFFLSSAQDLDFTPVLRDQFPALLDNQTAIPPDTHGAVGPEHLMVTLNTEVAVQTRQGNLLSKISLSRFWAGLNHEHVVDPKVLYDHLARRWFVTTVADPHTTNSAVLIAVSQTEDPTGGWHQCSIPIDPEGKLWADYPNIGYNQNWVAATYNIFSTETNAFVRSEVFAFRKPGFYDGETAEYARVYDPGFFTVVPATTNEENEPDL